MKVLSTWLPSIQSPLLPWVAGSFLACVLAANACWLLRSRTGRLGPYGPWLAGAARFVFFLGVPYLALGGWPRRPFSGLLSLEDLGLVGLGPRWSPNRWLGAAGTALELGLAAFLLLLLAWASARRALRFPPRPWGALLVDGLGWQAHWAFYRGALAVALGDVYAGTFLGLGLVYLEWALDPFWWQGWRSQEDAGPRWLHAALALVTAVIFYCTRNLWACLGLHWLLDLAFRRLGRETRPSYKV